MWVVLVLAVLVVMASSGGETTGAMALQTLLTRVENHRFLFIVLTHHGPLNRTLKRL